MPPVTTSDELRRWIDEAFEAGVVAFDTETTSLDPMQADLVGFSLCRRAGPRLLCPARPPPAGQGDLFGGGDIRRANSPSATRSRCLRPLMEAPGVLKIGQNIKFDWHVLAQRGIETAPIDDTMLISYALDAGATNDGHGMDALAERWLGHKTIHFADVAGSGKNFIGFARVAIDKATEYAAEDVDVTLRLWRALKPRLAGESMTTVYETLERPLVVPLARMERRGVAIDREILSRLSGEFAQGMARLEAEIHALVGAPFNLGSPKQLGDILFGQMGLPRRQEDRDRRLVDFGQRARRSRRRGPLVAGAHSRLAPARQAQIDLYRRAARLRQSRHRPRAHVLRARRDDHRAPVLVRPQPAEHSGAQ